MCGIFGYICAKKNASGKPVTECLKGLKLLEYRGYDSAGIAGMQDGNLTIHKTVGKVQDLTNSVKSLSLKLQFAIAHTRWATHGALTKENAHPHLDQNAEVAVVHNGIIENYSDIKKHLSKHSIVFSSETDTEAIAQLFAYQFKGDLLKATADILPLLKGSFAFALIHKNFPNTIIASARGCPLVIGISKKTKEVFLSSDINAFSGKNLEVLFINDNEIVLIKDDHVQVYDLEGSCIQKPLEKLGLDVQEISKNGYEHYMLKEIFEQPQTIKQTLHGRYQEEFGTCHFEELHIPIKDFQSVHHILILGCGTSWHAGCVAASMLESIARIPTQAEIASEFRYTNPIVSENTLVIAISQSGETADTIAAVKEAKAKGAKILGICNIKNSSLTREADSCIFLRAGPEISVCSTKAFTSQLIVLSLLTLHMARLHHLDKEEGIKFVQDLKKLPGLVQEVLAQANYIQMLAKKYAVYDSFFFLGRRYMYPASLEAALKLKEISYLNACGFPAGEMKHGPIALINASLPVIAMCGNEQTIEKMVSNLMEVKSRGAPILAFAPANYKQFEQIANDALWLPANIPDELASIPYSVAAQLFAYYMAIEKGTDIDQPRNLAKSVTVE